MSFFVRIHTYSPYPPVTQLVVTMFVYAYTQCNLSIAIDVIILHNVTQIQTNATWLFVMPEAFQVFRPHLVTFASALCSISPFIYLLIYLCSVSLGGNFVLKFGGES